MRGLIEAHTALPRTLLVEAYWWTPTTIFLAKSAQAPLAFPNPYHSLTPKSNLFPPISLPFFHVQCSKGDGEGA